MRKTKRRVFRSKRRVLRSKRRVLRSKRSVLRIKTRRMQRKFKYQRGGETEEYLKLKIEEAIQKADDKKSNSERKHNEWNTTKELAFAAESNTKEQALVVKKLKPSNIMGMFSSASKSNPQETDAIARLAQLTAEENSLFEEMVKSNKEWHKSIIEKREMIEQALQLLETFVEKFPNDSSVSKYSKLIKTYRDHLLYTY